MSIHFTTEEQSERLLNAGLPANTADCYYGMKSINPSEDGEKYFPREIIVRQTEEQLRPDMFETTVEKLGLEELDRLAEEHFKIDKQRSIEKYGEP